MDIQVLYEDENIVAVNKPAGLLVHGTGRNKEENLSDWFAEKYPESLGVGESLKTNNEIVGRPGIVHRLDRETSGVILLAKTKEGYEYLKKQFQNRTVVKKYLAFAYGNVKDDFGSIDAPLGRSKGDFRQYTTPRKARGEMRDALTYYTVKGRAGGATLLEVIPKTGRTHQIRAHMASFGHPLVGDRLYGKSMPLLLGFTRVALHAHQIEFSNLSGTPVLVVAPPPSDFQAALSVFPGVSVT
ncbi:MAG: RluA family pseudouridine synthase [Patescibacteria group bacterium]